MIRVLIVDDSALVRRLLQRLLERTGDIEIIGSAADASIAREMVLERRPDVITLDLDLPGVDGLRFLAALMQHCPTPVVVVSAVAPRTGEQAMRALALGAVEVIEKPGSSYAAPEEESGTALAAAIRRAAVARVQQRTPWRTPRRTSTLTPVDSPAVRRAGIIAIGASTGGTRAIERILARFPVHAPGALIVQHMPAGFTRAFARRLDGCTPMHVREARDGDHVEPGLALVAPGARHMRLQRAERGGSASGGCSAPEFRVRLHDDPPVHHQRPSVDVLFHSVAEAAGELATGVLLTGMGCDGARGLLAMRERGAFTIAESEESCVVFGMPKEAIAMRAACTVLPVESIAGAVMARRER